MITISEYTTKTPLQMIGEFAGFCWGANTKDNEKNIKRAIDCIMSEHGRTEEFPDLYLIIENVDAKTLRELYTHIGGAPTRLQASTRYIDYEKKGVPVITPPSIENNSQARHFSGLCRRRRKIYQERQEHYCKRFTYHIHHYSGND